MPFKVGDKVKTLVDIDMEDYICPAGTEGVVVEVEAQLPGADWRPGVEIRTHDTWYMFVEDDELEAL